MEEGGDDVVTVCGTAECATVVGGGEGQARVPGHGVVAVDEIEIGQVGDAFKERAVTGLFDLVPADVGLLHGVWEASDFARENSEAVLLALGGEVEEDLEAHADAEKGLARSNFGEHGVEQAAVFQALHCGRRGALAGADQGIGGDKISGVGGDTGVVAQLDEGLLYTSEVAGSVVDDENERAGFAGLGVQFSRT